MEAERDAPSATETGAGVSRSGPNVMNNVDALYASGVTESKTDGVPPQEMPEPLKRALAEVVKERDERLNRLGKCMTQLSESIASLLGSARMSTPEDDSGMSSATLSSMGSMATGGAQVAAATQNVIAAVEATAGLLAEVRKDAVLLTATSISNR